MNIQSLAKELKRLSNKGSSFVVGAALAPHQLQYKHAYNLVTNDRIPVLTKAMILCDKKKTLHWSRLLNATEDDKRRRKLYKIDVEKHINEFDPTGTTLGCGCALCGLHNRVTTKEQQIRIYNAVLQFISYVSVRKGSFDYNPAKVLNNFSTFLNIHPHQISIFTVLANKTAPELVAYTEVYTKKLKDATKDMQKTASLLKKMKKQVNLPVSEKQIAKMGPKVKYHKALRYLVHCNDLQRLSLAKLISLNKDLQLPKVDENYVKRLNKLLTQRETVGTEAENLQKYAAKRINAIQSELLTSLNNYRDVVMSKKQNNISSEFGI